MRTEFEFIQHIKKSYSLNRVGDDCAVLPKDDGTELVVTTDMLVEDVDFRLDWTPPELLGWKALAVSLSDIAATGGEPKWSLVSLAVPERIWSTNFLDRFYEGWLTLAKQHGVELVGGDISKTGDKFVVDSMVGGDVPKGKAILRTGAKAKDRIFVSGQLGGAAGGLRLLENGKRFEKNLSSPGRELILKQLRPKPRVDLGKKIQLSNVVTAMIDISDGLSSDLRHLCRMSGVGAMVETVPVEKDLNEYFGGRESVELALHGGEDFELLMTASPENAPLLADLGLTPIGTVTSRVAVIELVCGDETTILEPRGFRHF